MKHLLKIGIIVFLLLPSFQGGGLPAAIRIENAEDRPSSLDSRLLTLNYNLDEIILDIYNAAIELSETDYEQLQTDLYALHDAPINLNTATDEELTQLYFLSPRQIDDILAYVGRHPMESIYELLLIPSLADYEVRDLLPFVYVAPTPLTFNNNMYAREVFHDAKHELITRIDARNLEQFEGTDPVYIQTRYKFDYQRRVMFGAQLRRPAGGMAEDLQYGAWLQLKDIGCLHTLVAGNFQASFGQGLVLAPVFRTGKSSYVSNIGQQQQGLRYYSSVDGQGLHGAGATFRKIFNPHTRLDISALYSMRRANDSVWHHLVGTNLTLRHKRLQVELTAIENIWSDSIRPYRNMAYNQHYFRGTNQAVLGASVRYNHGWFDAFAELATAQNFKRFKETLNGEASQREALNSQKWGFGAIAGSRFYPASGISLVALYRYYSPYFDNALGYAFSETSRIGDENGFYLGFDLSRWRNWRINGYADLFYFSGRKYGISYAPSWGYDALLETQYHSPLTANRSPFTVILRLRAKEKGRLATYSIRAQFNYEYGQWSFRTTAEANLTSQRTSGSINLQSSINSAPSALNAAEPQYAYGYTVFQDISLDLSRLSPLTSRLPLGFYFRAQAFDARDWANRIYCYEHDVLYAFSVPAVYGLGGRAYLGLRWQIIPQLALYFRVSETLYARDWYISKHPEWPSNLKSPISNPKLSVPSRTDLHLLLRATL
jgi:hypothetical protein